MPTESKSAWGKPLIVVSSDWPLLSSQHSNDVTNIQTGTNSSIPLVHVEDEDKRKKKETKKKAKKTLRKPRVCYPMAYPLPSVDPSYVDMETIKYWIRYQLEFYFSPENLVRDAFFRSQMSSVDGGVPLNLILGFNRVKCLMELARQKSLVEDPLWAVHTVLESLLASEFIELVHQPETRLWVLRRKLEWHSWSSSEMIYHPPQPFALQKPPLVQAQSLVGNDKNQAIVPQSLVGNDANQAIVPAEELVENDANQAIVHVQSLVENDANQDIVPAEELAENDDIVEAVQVQELDPVETIIQRVVSPVVLQDQVETVQEELPMAILHEKTVLETILEEPVEMAQETMAVEPETKDLQEVQVPAIEKLSLTDEGPGTPLSMDQETVTPMEKLHMPTPPMSPFIVVVSDKKKELAPAAEPIEEANDDGWVPATRKKKSPSKKIKIPVRPPNVLKHLWFQASRDDYFGDKNATSVDNIWILALDPSLNVEKNSMQKITAAFDGGIVLKPWREDLPILGFLKTDLTEQGIYDHAKSLGDCSALRALKYTTYRDDILKQRSLKNKKSEEYMGILYLFWSFYLQSHLSTGSMYRSFRDAAIEDARSGSRFGLECLYQLFAGLSKPKKASPFARKSKILPAHLKDLQFIVREDVFCRLAEDGIAILSGAFKNEKNLKGSVLSDLVDVLNQYERV